MTLNQAIVGFLIAAVTSVSYAQNSLTPIKEPLPAPSPSTILSDLLNLDVAKDGSTSAPASNERQSKMLSAIGVKAVAIEGARLSFVDLDGDGAPEALLVVDIDYATVALIVLKEKDGQWYRLPSDKELSCWCRYERSSLDRFVETVEWNYSFQDKPGPKQLIVVRSSGGGTGIYERSVQFFALDGDRIREVFTTTEERREYPLPLHMVQLEHSVVTIDRDAKRENLAITEIKIKRNISPDHYAEPDESWWVGQPITYCKAFLWDQKTFHFTEDKRSANDFCPSAPKRVLLSR